MGKIGEVFVSASSPPNVIENPKPGHSPASGVVTAWLALSPAPLEVITRLIIDIHQTSQAGCLQLFTIAQCAVWQVCLPRNRTS